MKEENVQKKANISESFRKIYEDVPSADFRIGHVELPKRE